MIGLAPAFRDCLTSLSAVTAVVLLVRWARTNRHAGPPRCYPERVMSRVVALTLVVLAVLVSPLAMATAHCLAGDCEGFCVSAVAPAPTMITAIAAVVSATADPAAAILTVPIRLSEPPPRSLHATV
jgi:hypothetical protein